MISSISGKASLVITDQIRSCIALNNYLSGAAELPSDFKLKPQEETASATFHQASCQLFNLAIGLVFGEVSTQALLEAAACQSAM